MTPPSDPASLDVALAIVLLWQKPGWCFVSWAYPSAPGVVWRVHLQVVCGEAQDAALDVLPAERSFSQIWSPRSERGSVYISIPFEGLVFMQAFLERSTEGQGTFVPCAQSKVVQLPQIVPYWNGREGSSDSAAWVVAPQERRT